MLVLTRKLNEAIVVDGGVEITVLAVKGNRIRLGIQAPKNVSIRRGELPPLESTAPRSLEVEVGSSSPSTAMELGA